MWSRANFKQQAKNVLTNSYWLSFAVCLLAGIITRAGSVVSSRINSSSTVISGRGSDYSTGLFSNLLNSFMFSGFLLLVFLFIMVLSIAVTIFLASPIKVGQYKFFLESRKGRRNFENLFSSFREGRYLNIVKGMAWTTLFTFLWTLLFIIPGIIKAYSYSMVPYLLADNPNMNYDRAIKLSMRMTDGYKWDIFVLQLSFIGWYLLGALCCGIGVLFVTPYYVATFTEMYAFLRKNAVEKGFCNPAELNLTQEDSMMDYPTQPNY